MGHQVAEVGVLIAVFVLLCAWYWTNQIKLD